TVAVDGGRDVELHALLQGDLAHRREHGAVDGGLVVPGDRALAPRAAADGVDLSAGEAVGAGCRGYLQMQLGRGDRMRAGPGHVDAEEGALHRTRIGHQDRARAGVAGGTAGVHEGVGRDRCGGDRRWAGGRRAAHAGAAGTGVGGRAGVAVIAWQGVRGVHAARRRVARVRRAHVGIVAVDRWPARTGVRGGAGVAVVAGQRVRGASHAGGGAVAGAAADARVVGAGLAGRLELAGRRAAVARGEVAVVALLAEVDDAVATDVRDLADDRAELVGLLPTGGEARTLDPNEVRTAGAADDRPVR